MGCLVYIGDGRRDEDWLTEVLAMRDRSRAAPTFDAVSYTHLRAHETVLDLVCRLLLEKKKAHHSHKIITTLIQ